MIFKKLFFSIIITSVFASCSMVKSPQSANFDRVKYNAHLKLAKKELKERLPETVKSFEQESASTSSKSPKLERMELKKLNTPVMASTNSLSPQMASPIKVSTNQVSIESSKKEKPLMGLFGQATELMHPKSIKEYLNKPLPVAVDNDSALGNLLYLILVVILVLIIIGIISDLAGGAIGALIAVLLILLILRLLGII